VNTLFPFKQRNPELAEMLNDKEVMQQVLSFSDICSTVLVHLLSHIYSITHWIIACVAVQGSIKDDFSSKGKTLCLTAHQTPILTDRYQTWQN